MFAATARTESDACCKRPRVHGITMIRIGWCFLPWLSRTMVGRFDPGREAAVEIVRGEQLLAVEIGEELIELLRPV